METNITRRDALKTIGALPLVRRTNSPPQSDVAARITAAIDNLSEASRRLAVATAKARDSVAAASLRIREMIRAEQHAELLNELSE